MNNPLAIASIALLFVLGGVIWHTEQQKTYYQQQALPVIGDMLMDISNWERESIRKHLSNGARQVIGDQQLDALISNYQSLGRFKSTDNLEFSRLVSALSLLGDSRASYSGTARFENADAHFTMTLLWQDGRFAIYNFNISRL